MNILVTGARGFVGRNLCATLKTLADGRNKTRPGLHIGEIFQYDVDTDPALLELTGGIVQGMSGSPIIQDGRLVGAVTHVLVNDPTRGYAVFAENMREAQQQSAQLSAQTAA